MITEKQLQNLKKSKGFSGNSTEKQRIISQKGGIASGEAKRAKKTMKECAMLFGSLGVDEKTAQSLKKQGVGGDDLTHNMAVIYGLFASAMRGNSNAGRVILELVGDIKQAQTNITVTNNVNPYANLTEDELRKLAKGE
jgi:hypothetical protein